jgi:DNA (cytosine-5)-methyltransferase 1
VNYYNEHDKKAAQWLRELIKAGEIPNGSVDERDIKDVKSDELKQYTQCHFFAGIGGWSLALKLAGWPTDRPVWTGSCPCQPFSSAGKGLGKSDPRHLWPTFFNLIKECNPNIVFGEQVASAIGKGWLDGISADLESEDYAVGRCVLGAHSIGAPHIRQRLYWLADATMSRRHWALQEPEGETRHETRMRLPGEDGRTCRMGHSNLCENLAAVAGQQMSGARCHPADRNGSTAQGTRKVDTAWDYSELIACSDGKARRIESGTFPLAHGIPGRVGLLRGYGNAIVPQVAQVFIESWIDCQSLVQ